VTPPLPRANDKAENINDEAKNQTPRNYPWHFSTCILHYPRKEVVEQQSSLFLGYLKTFFYHRSTACLRDPLGRWPFSTKVCIGTYGPSLSWHTGGVSGGHSQTRSPLPHTCWPAGAALSWAQRAAEGTIPLKGPLWTVYKTPVHFFYFSLLNPLSPWRPVWVTTLKRRLPFKLDGNLHCRCR